jgi:hypothetical protein
MCGHRPYADRSVYTSALTCCITLMCCTTGVSGQFSGGPGAGGATSCLPSMIVLPVQLLHMEAICDEETPSITWSTATERNNSHFVIERSTNAEYWEEVGRVESAGNSQQTTEYAWRDEAPLPASVVYYRLRQVDLDGREEVLAVLPVEACAAGGITLSVVPNPTDGLVEVLWSTENGSSSITELQLLDAQGRVLLNHRVTDVTGTRWTMDLTALSAGSYTVLGVDASGVQVGSARMVRR